MYEFFGWLTWTFPFVGAILTPAMAKINPKMRDYGAIAFSFLGATSAGLLIPFALFQSPLDIQVNWIQSLDIKAGILLDPLSIIMVNVVSWISFLIMVYSLAYMHGDDGLTRYWFFMNFFIGNMLLLVMSDNLLQLFFGWEGVGLCSYALIGHWYKDPVDKWVGSLDQKSLNVPMAYPPSHAGMKALVVTRVGDIGLLIAIFMIYALSGTLNFVDLSSSVTWAAPLLKMGLLVPLALLFFWGPIGKSAQFPLHEWLPDAMAGPTSVSALIHAATMVTAGVYLAARAGPMFYNIVVQLGQPTYFFEVIAWAGAFTTFMAATQAVVSKELKKLLAYSTISQIGYMMLGIGAGGMASEFVTGMSAGIFHLMTHALFKAAAFLAAGAILHSVESRFMGDMGGLSKSMRITFISMLVALLALSGVPPLSGFWSKDAIIAATVLTGQLPLMLLAWGTVALTFLYSLKVVGLVFLGPPSDHVRKLEEEGHHVHEAPRLMWVPYVIMAAATVLIGLAGPYVEAFFTHALAITVTPLAETVPAVSSASEQQAGVDRNCWVADHATRGGISRLHALHLKKTEPHIASRRKRVCSVGLRLPLEPLVHQPTLLSDLRLRNNLGSRRNQTIRRTRILRQDKRSSRSTISQRFNWRPGCRYRSDRCDNQWHRPRRSKIVLRTAATPDRRPAGVCHGLCTGFVCTRSRRVVLAFMREQICPSCHSLSLHQSLVL